jgi:hypothetical protein
MKALLLTSLLLTVAASAATPKAATSPKIVFVGDQVTANWPLTQTNPNWINLGQPGAASATVAASFQTAINLQPAVIHILVGLVDQEYDTREQQGPDLTTTNVLSALQTMVQEARAANIQVVLGLEPQYQPQGATNLEPTATNAVVAAYGSQQGIQVISYQITPMTSETLPSGLPVQVPTAYGYQQMTAALLNVLPTVNLKLGGGYLQNIGYDTYPYAVLLSNRNTVGPGVGLQFTAVGWYNDGSTHEQLNTNSVGATGTWTSSNPLVMSIDQTGSAYSLSAGTSIIRYTSLSGVAFSEWVMYVDVD